MAGTYSRLYHRLMSEYPRVWKSDAQLAAFVRLLVVADKFYPEPAPLPDTRNYGYLWLKKAGLVVEQVGEDGKAYGYSVRGLEAERERRSHAGRNAAASRWGMPRRDETRQEENISANASINGSPKPPRDSRAEGLWHHGQHPNCSTCQQYKAAR